MKAWVAGTDGPRLAEVDAPRPGAADVLVRVHAAALNRADLFMAGGGSHGALGGEGAVLGLEWAGEVVETGSDVADFKPGDRVMGSGGSAFAEFAVSDAGRVSPMPPSMDFETAAVLPVALQTMHNAVVTEGALEAGQAVLVHGASSGVGLMGLKVAKLRGAGVAIGSARDPGRRARLAEFGADLAVDPDDPLWVEQVKAATGGKGADLVIDQISGPRFNLTLRATRIKGRIVNVGRLGGQTGEVDFNLHALRRITYTGVTFRSRSKAEVAEIVRLMHADLGEALAAGRLDLPIDSAFDFLDLPAALARMDANRHFGKIVLRGAR